MVELAITLGLIFSLLSYEVFGLAAGGIVVPGYIALAAFTTRQTCRNYSGQFINLPDYKNFR